jgi:hypothetical protein
VIEMEVVPANDVEDTGDETKYTENTQFLADVEAKLKELAEPQDENSGSILQESVVTGIDGAVVKGIQVEANYGVGATSGDTPTNAGSTIVLGSFSNLDVYATTTPPVVTLTPTNTAAATTANTDTDSAKKDNGGNGAAVGTALAIVFVVLLGAGYLVHRKKSRQSTKVVTSAKDLGLQPHGGFTTAVEGVDYNRRGSGQIQQLQYRPQSGASFARALQQRDSIMDEFEDLGGSLGFDAATSAPPAHPRTLPVLRLDDPHPESRSSWVEPAFVPSSNAVKSRRPSTVSMV